MAKNIHWTFFFLLPSISSFLDENNDWLQYIKLLEWQKEKEKKRGRFPEKLATYVLINFRTAAVLLRKLEILWPPFSYWVQSHLNTLISVNDRKRISSDNLKTPKSPYLWNTSFSPHIPFCFSHQLLFQSRVPRQALLWAKLWCHGIY